PNPNSFERAQSMTLRKRVVLSASIAVAACQPAGKPADPAKSGGRSYDIVISGGKIIDGTGNSWFYGDIAIDGDRIARITPPGLLAKTEAKQRLDATGKIVAPGFIDI